jgi:RNA polymerase sigma-70 factor (ECF subfamily)
MRSAVDSLSLSTGVRIPCETTPVDYASLTAVELVRLCAEEGDAVAWREFIQRFQRVIATVAYRVARRWGENAQTVVDDLVQETYLKLCSDHARILREFQSPHPDAIFGFLKVVAANVANDHFKRLHTGKRGGDVTRSLEHAERTAGPSGSGDPASMERAVLIGEIDSCLRTEVPAETRKRDCAIFSLYYRQGLTAREIAALPSIGLTVKGVESTLHRLMQLVRSHLVEAGRMGPGSSG